MTAHYLPFSKDIFPKVRSLSLHEPQRRRFESPSLNSPQEYLDFYFTLDPRTPILASRSGTVLRALENYSIAKNPAANELVLHQTNLVRIIHDDATVAEYVHLFPRIREGQSINAGDQLGELGGWAMSYSPHLHLDFFKDDRLEAPADVSFLKMSNW